MAVPFLPIAEGCRTESAAADVPMSRFGSSIWRRFASSPDSPVPTLIDLEHQQHQRRAMIGQVLDPVPEVVLQVLDVLQRVEGPVLDLPATVNRAGQLAGVVRMGLADR